MNDNGLNGSTRGFKGVWIPAAIFENPELCWTDKVLWAIIYGFSGDGGCCFATNAWFSARLGVGERGVRLALGRLKDAGLLLTYGDGVDERRQLVVVVPKEDAASSAPGNLSSAPGNLSSAPGNLSSREGEREFRGGGEREFRGGGEREFRLNKKILIKNIYNTIPPTPFGGCPPYGVDPHLEDEREVLNPPMPSDEGERLSAKGGAQTAEVAPPPTPAPEKAKTFRKPTAAEVAEYAASRGESIEAELFCDFYESKGWRVGKSAMKDWRAAVRNWCARSRSEGGAQASGRERRGADDVLAHNLQIRDKLCGGDTFGAVFGGGAKEIGEGER